MSLLSLVRIFRLYFLYRNILKWSCSLLPPTPHPQLLEPHSVYRKIFVLLFTEGSEWCDPSTSYRISPNRFAKDSTVQRCACSFLPTPLHWRSWQAPLLARLWALTEVLPSPQAAYQRNLLQNCVRFHFLFLFLVQSANLRNCQAQSRDKREVTVTDSCCFFGGSYITTSFFLWS